MRQSCFLACTVMLIGICMVSMTTGKKRRDVSVMFGGPVKPRPDQGTPEFGSPVANKPAVDDDFWEYDMYEYYRYDDDYGNKNEDFNEEYYYNANVYNKVWKDWPDKRRGLQAGLIDSAGDASAVKRSAERESASFWKTDERRKSQRRRESVDRAARESAELWWPGGSGTLVSKGDKDQMVKKRGGWSDSTHPGGLSNLVKKAADKVSFRRPWRDLLKKSADKVSFRRPWRDLLKKSADKN